MPRRTHVFLAAAATAAALLAAGCGTSAAEGGTAGSRQVKAVQAKPTPAAPHSAAPSPTASATAAATVDPGTLPQTNVLPGDRDAQFQVGAYSLWQAIVQDKPQLAHAFFFPLTAYRQVKAIWDIDADYQNRLIAWYDLDIQAAHDHLGPAADARFVSMDVPESNAEWIEPGVEYNKGSYYRVYGTRLNYEVNGHAESIGVFSLISWRGEWYVVHLGPSTRAAMQGIVYDPSN
ncbi:hypothetical protein KDK95_11275 [Actinospica sp. MGRD01-02]|uniref:Tat pathway signal sequence domain protein n=1 Tax=Actinospica acidithermotolerans TaxID=2828514 RepID=A0A941EAU8_9ACTN|nr:hypothetical protein [Actinospica acidithermotolerans]MBR7826885.1 hypothetical protein [Actinospica acidithermotolerans]